MFYLACRCLTITCVYIYPVYATYKSLQSNDTAKNEALLMYWSIIAIITLFEACCEWVVNWLPFYYLLKTVVLLWLTLPQIQGSTYIYLTHVHPFFLSHENDIDNAILEFKEKMRLAGLDYIKRAIEYGKTLIFSQLTAEQSNTADVSSTTSAKKSNTNATANEAVSNQAWNIAGQLLRDYSHAILHPMQHVPASSLPKEKEILVPVEHTVISSPLSNTSNTAASSTSAIGNSTSSQIRQRRMELENELNARSSPMGMSMNASLIGGQYEQVDRPTASDSSPSSGSTSGQATVPSGLWSYFTKASPSAVNVGVGKDKNSRGTPTKED